MLARVMVCVSSCCPGRPTFRLLSPASFAVADERHSVYASFRYASGALCAAYTKLLPCFTWSL